jgi:hypothetical protein
LDVKHLKEKYKDLKLDGGFNAQLDKAIEPKTIKEIKKILGIKDADIASMFGYKDAVTFRNSTRRHHIESGIESLYSIIKSNNVNS